MRPRVNHPSTGLIFSLVLLVGCLSAETETAPRLDVSAPEVMRTTLKDMSAGLAHREVWGFTGAIRVLIASDSWSWEQDYDPQVSVKSMIENTASTLEQSVDRKHRVDGKTVSELIHEVEALRSSMRLQQLTALEREIEYLEGMIAESLASTDEKTPQELDDVESFRSRLYFLKEKATELESMQ